MKLKTTIQIDIEVTDTFGGEANYCWVRRTRVTTADTPYHIVRAAKRFAGLTGVRCQVSCIGGGALAMCELIEIRPVGKRAPAIVCFVTVGEDFATD